MATRSALITDARELIGSHLIQQAKEKVSAWYVVPLNRQLLNLIDFAAVQQRFDEDAPPFLLIHCAAMSNTAQCRDHAAEAQRLNGGGLSPSGNRGFNEELELASKNNA